MKRTDLLRAIGDAAASSGRTLEFSVPRHREVGERLALAVRQSLETELGEGWWR